MAAKAHPPRSFAQALASPRSCPAPWVRVDAEASALSRVTVEAELFAVTRCAVANISLRLEGVMTGVPTSEVGPARGMKARPGPAHGARSEFTHALIFGHP